MDFSLSELARLVLIHLPAKSWRSNIHVLAKMPSRNAPRYQWPGPFLDWLRPQRIDCFVVSGTPQVPLRETVRRIGLEDRFVDVLGDPTGKSQHYVDNFARKAAALLVGGQFVRVKEGRAAPFRQVNGRSTH